MTIRVQGTADAYFGLDDPTQDEWEAWHRAMLEERASVVAAARIDRRAYADDETAWSDATFRQVFLFLYDRGFYDPDAGEYRTAEIVERWRAMFGRVDSVLLWHAYPRLGFDSRTQFDFYRDMPGGIARLRAEVTDVLHARGIRVFVDYNPWDAGTYDELGDIVSGLDADGVMLDTMTDLPEALARAVRARKKGVVFAPERRPADADLSQVRQSWAQWYDVGDAATPSIYRHRWIAPRHRQLAIRRWDTSRRYDIAYSFFNGSGLLLWDNVFGVWNPYSREDRRLIAETAAVFDRYADLFVHGEWEPLVPTGVSGLDANRWSGAIAAGGGTRATLLTLRNRTGTRLHYRVPPAPSSSAASPAPAYFAFWGDGGERRELQIGDKVAIEPEGVQALVLDDPARARAALAHFDRLSRRADVAWPEYDERCPRPRAVLARPEARASAATAATAQAAPAARLIDLPGGVFDVCIRHERRECGCYPWGATDEAMWGWQYKDIVAHEGRVTLKPFAIRETAVTNAEFVAFVHAAGYRPADGERFLKHIVRGGDGSLPRSLPAEQASLPVTFVSLADARAYAAWHGQRLPAEAEWQWAAEGAGAGHRYPWGDDERSFPNEVRPALDPTTATPQGVTGLSGNTWELTESEHTDGHTRFVLLRGGVYLPRGDTDSEWLVARGAQPNDSHAKYILLADGLDRSETISFRTVVDLA
jgi:formylglycine-generating enzyme required for sulfatase activity